MMPWGRVGSNFLSSLINNSFDKRAVHFVNEPLYEMRDAARQEAWFREFYRDAGDARLIASKHALRALEDRAATGRLFAELGLSLLRMRRANIVKVAVSHERARLYATQSEQLTGKARWGVRRGETPLPPTPLDPQSFVETLALVHREDDALRDFQPDCPIYDLDYEALVADEPQILREIFAWLDIAPDRRPGTLFVKATPDDLGEAVPNLDELRRAARESGFEALDPMFDS